MIHTLGTHVADLDTAQREDLELLRQQREAVAKYWATVAHEMKTAAAEQDADFAAAIARREAMIGEPAMQYQQAAE
ncbi:MAG: hypothetical protein H0X01_02025 [Nitrospira sp.]|nr:hypothetical protein [Nitrospira sp.]